MNVVKLPWKPGNGGPFLGGVNANIIMMALTLWSRLKPLFLS